jgi:hypothetical protein
MTIFTPRKLAQQSRRRDRQNAAIGRVLAQMRRGACLHLSHAPRPHWRLSTGEFVTEEAARTLINTPSVVSVGDALFTNELAQSPKPRREPWQTNK